MCGTWGGHRSGGCPELSPQGDDEHSGGTSAGKEQASGWREAHREMKAEPAQTPNVGLSDRL